MVPDIEMFLILCCFSLIFTVVSLLLWFGADVPRILRNPEETESILPIPERQMMKVDNPFFLQLGSRPACVTGGVCVRPSCLQPCVITCFWGCEVGALQEALQTHQSRTRLSSSGLFQQVLRLRCSFCQTFHVTPDGQQELHTQIPSSFGVSDFGPVPRERYPLVVVLTFRDSETQSSSSIVANVTVVHIPDDKHRTPARILFEYLLTAQGNVHKLMSIFMAADVSDTPEALELQSRARPGQQAEGGDCVVCRSAPVNRVLLPCRHACVCDGCVSHFQNCPVCRAFVLESFALAPPSSSDSAQQL